MNETFLRYYEDELRHVHEVAAEFGASHPAVAGHLKLRSDGCDDPFVERLLEGFAFLSARVHQKLDSDFPVFTQALAETVYPSLLCPAPSMGIVELSGDPALTESLRVPRGSVMTGHLGPDSDTRCEFRTSQEVVLHPVSLARDEQGRARYFDRDLDLLRLPSALPVKAAMRLRLQMPPDSGTIGGLADLDELVIHIRAGLGAAGRIYEELFAHATHLVMTPTGLIPQAFGIHPLGTEGGAAIMRVGFEHDEALLPVDSRVFEGYRVLREYMAMPQRLCFFRLTGLRRMLAEVATSSVDLIIGFDRSSPELGQLIRPETFVLNATPVVNLFERRADQIVLDRSRSEFHVVVDRTKPIQYEVLAVTEVASAPFSGAKVTFQPFYRCGSADPGAKAFFSIRREKRVLGGNEKREGPLSRYLGSEVFLSLVDGRNAPYPEEIDALSAKVLCSNRHLPLSMVLKGADTDLIPESGLPVASVRWILPPTAPMESLADGANTWRFINHLSLNYLSLVERGGSGGSVLRDLLAIYVPDTHDETFDWIAGIASVSSEPVIRRMPGGGPVAFQRGLSVKITFDERRFAGASPFLCGTMLAHFLANYVTLNSFVETSLLSTSRGKLKTWPALVGVHPLV